VRGARRVVAAAEDEVRSHLDSGEKLLWAGRPAQGIVLRRQDWHLIPFSVVWFSVAVFAFWQTLTKTPEPFALSVAAGLLFIGIGIYWLIGRFFADRWYRSRLIYGVTDRRAIILSGMRRRSVQSIYLSSLMTLKLEERQHGIGTICFGDQPRSTYGPEFRPAIGTQFFRIADAKKVYTILHETMQRQKK
jgi:hypothetical protein